MEDSYISKGEKFNNLLHCSKPCTSDRWNTGTIDNVLQYIPLFDLHINFKLDKFDEVKVFFQHLDNDEACSVVTTLVQNVKEVDDKEDDWEDDGGDEEVDDKVHDHINPFDKAFQKAIVKTFFLMDTVNELPKKYRDHWADLIFLLQNIKKHWPLLYDWHNTL